MADAPHFLGVHLIREKRQVVLGGWSSILLRYALFRVMHQIVLVADAPHFLGVHLILREAPDCAGWLELRYF